MSDEDDGWGDSPARNEKAVVVTAVLRRDSDPDATVTNCYHASSSPLCSNLGVRYTPPQQRCHHHLPGGDDQRGFQTPPEGNLLHGSHYRRKH